VALIISQDRSRVRGVHRPRTNVTLSGPAVVAVFLESTFVHTNNVLLFPWNAVLRLSSILIPEFRCHLN
jgi:hypothetical protein